MAKNAKQDKDQEQATEQVADAGTKTIELKYSTARRSDLPKHLQGLEIPFTIPSGETLEEVQASILARCAGSTDAERAAALRDTFNKGFKLDVQKAIVAAGQEKDATEATMRDAGAAFKATPNQRGGGTRGTSAKARAQRAEAKVEAAQDEILQGIREFLDDGMPEAAAKMLARAERLGSTIPQELRDEVEAAVA